jgi:hypothetical protein
LDVTYTLTEAHSSKVTNSGEKEALFAQIKKERMRNTNYLRIYTINIFSKSISYFFVCFSFFHCYLLVMYCNLCVVLKILFTHLDLSYVG